MSALQRFVGIFNGRTHRPDPVAPPAAPAADVVTGGDAAPEADGYRYAHGQAVVDGVVYRFTLNRQTCELNIRRNRARSGVTYSGAELVAMMLRHREGSLRL